MRQLQSPQKASQMEAFQQEVVSSCFKFISQQELGKEVHFISIRSTHKVSDIERIFMKEVFRLHGLPKELFSK